ncbi:hypothetical protein [Streptomyces sp. NPDC052114]|uniref:hypothetical protein n=1 Tax=unclassified Streptomyces TaxID=2593676 RepID=UPI00341E691B
MALAQDGRLNSLLGVGYADRRPGSSVRYEVDVGAPEFSLPAARRLHHLTETLLTP